MAQGLYQGLGSCCYCCWAVVVWIGIILVKMIGYAATLFFALFIKKFRYQVPNMEVLNLIKEYKGYFGDGLSLT